MSIGEPKRIGEKCVTRPYPATGFIGSLGFDVEEHVIISPVCSRCERKIMDNAFVFSVKVDFTAAYEEWIVQKVLKT